MTAQSARPPVEHTDSEETKQKKLKKKLDKELEDSFPASDPPSTTAPTPDVPAGDPRTKP